MVSNNVFYEQLYKRHKQAKDYAIQALIFFGCVALSGVACLLLSFLLPKIGFPRLIGRTLGIFAIIGIVWVGYKQFMRFDREFEYSYLNGEFDVDIIYTKTERKRLLSFKTKDFETFGEYTPEVAARLKNTRFDAKYDFLSYSKDSENKKCYAILNVRNVGKTLILIEPKAEILADMQRYRRLGTGE